MEQTVDQPAKVFSPAQVACRFTSANAREMQRRAQEKREQRKNPPPQAPLIPTDQANDQLRARVERVDERIEAILDDMEIAETAKDQQALAMAFRALNEVWSLLTGHPRPGVRKESKGRSKVTYAQPQE